MPVIIQKAYEPTERPTVECTEQLTEQAHRDTCNINKILADYTRTGLIAHAAKFEGQYDDFPAIDFQQAMVLIKNTETMFNALPAATRKEFGNDPAAFLAFAQDEANAPRLKELGIERGNDGINFYGLPSKPPPAPTPAPEPNPTPPETPVE